MQGVIIIIINKEGVGTWGAGEAGRGRHSGWEGRGRAWKLGGQEENRPGDETVKENRE